ncbi:hypothetical protein, partial [Nocardia sp. R6R-6]|uniref:hypothetical protein n=1 Tax=Nocardia sp. R6R-6 TaxID=3459303 RepID=UPI00403D865E
MWTVNSSTSRDELPFARIRHGAQRRGDRPRYPPGPLRQPTRDNGGAAATGLEHETRPSDPAPPPRPIAP